MAPRHASPDTEPAISIGAIIALVAAVLAAAVAFGVPITSDQRETILAVIATAGPIVAALFIRGRVTPNDNVAARVDRPSGQLVAGPAVEDINDGARVDVVKT